MLRAVAGRAVYELILTPKQSDTLVARVVIAMDAETRIPLRVQVFSTQLPDPAYEVGFTSVDFSTPDAELFAFTPPPGATVTEHAADDMKAAAATRPWRPTRARAHRRRDRVEPGRRSRRCPTDLAGRRRRACVRGRRLVRQGGLDAAALLESLPRTSGEWGSGRVLSGTLVSAILTDDGRIAIGAVTPETLAAALAAQ